MPTYDVTERFWTDWRRLTPDQQAAFMAAREHFVSDLRAGRAFRRSLRVKGVRGQRGMYEMTWAGDGRATFVYGQSRRGGEAHIMWARIGGHEVIGKL